MADGGITPYKGRDANTIIAQALEMYEEQGLEIAEAAPILNVPARTIHRWLATNASERWKEAQQARALDDYERARKARYTAHKAMLSLQQTLDDETQARIDRTEGEEKLKAADILWSQAVARERNWRLTHAREVLAAADQELEHQKWLLERLLSRLYGVKQELTAVGITVVVQRDTTTGSAPAAQHGQITDAEVVNDA